jgi:hypothetical protein
MENHLTTRTYTADTCELIVSRQDTKPPANSPHQSAHPVDFTLHLDRSELGEGDRVTLQGQPRQLEYLHQIVSNYVAELVAKFPLPATHPPQSPSPATELPQIDPVEPPPAAAPPHRSSARSGIIKNLPGLRSSLPQSVPPSQPDPQSPSELKPSISSLLGQGQTSPGAQATTLPYLIAAGDRHLEHHFHLGTLSNSSDGAVLTLSAIQLFDLAAVLDEYTADPSLVRPDPLSRASIPVSNDRPSNQDTSRSGLPNVPNRYTEAAPSEVYYRTKRSRPSFMSGLPWAIAAAALVCVPLLLLDPNANPFKDALSKLKMPDLGNKKAATTTGKNQKETTTSTSSDPTATLPTPWQSQAIAPPPTVTKPTTSPSSTAQDPSKIGTGSLPGSTSNKSATVLPTTSPSGTKESTIAPNPLASSQVPTDLKNGSDSSNGWPTTNSTTKSTTPTGATVPTASPSSTTERKKIVIGQLPVDSDNAGKMSVSKQPIAIPPPSVANPAGNTTVPFDFPTGTPQSSNSATTTPTKPKKTVSKVKPTPTANNANSQPANSTGNGVNSSPKVDPITPVVKNPNLIDPNQNNNEGSSEPQTATVVPDRPLQSNSGADIDTANNPSLEETKRYFQGKWKANPAQPNALQYVLQISGKSGVVRSVSPQGEAATTYLQQTKLIKPGQKLVSPVAAGNSDRKIRVLLQPDGGVDTFIEP